MLHPATELRYLNAAIGYGVFTTAFIPRGTFVWVLDAWERILAPPAVAALPRLLPQQVEKYADITAAGHYVLCGDSGRYMPHSCQPTSLGLGAALAVAIRDLAPGEEFPCQDATLHLTTAFACGGQQQTCRTRIGAADLDRFWEPWEQTVAHLLPTVSQVEQPLMPFIQAMHVTGWSWMASSSASPSPGLPREMITPAQRRNRRASHAPPAGFGGESDMLHPATQLRYRNAAVGHGVFATAAMPLRAALPLALTLPQPLWPLVNPTQVCQAFERLALPRPTRLAIQAASYTTLGLPGTMATRCAMSRRLPTEYLPRRCHAGCHSRRGTRQSHAPADRQNPQDATID
jgi:hypothetical protein